MKDFGENLLAWDSQQRKNKSNSIKKGFTEKELREFKVKNSGISMEKYLKLLGIKIGETK